MLETHPFGNFVPPKAKYLLLGSFTGKPDDNYQWFYGSKRNQFWRILEQVYDIELDTKDKQQALFTKLQMALTDIILSCERRANSNLDMNLINITFNIEAVVKIVSENKIQRIYFSSRFVEKLFRKHFKSLISDNIELITLPSPSPRYAAMSKTEKIKNYKTLLPKL